MSLLTVRGRPVAPTGKTLETATLTVVYSASYTEGITGDRYPTRYVLSYDSLNDCWKPEGTDDGTLAKLPGGQSGEPATPSARFTEYQKYTDGDEQTFAWSHTIVGVGGEWYYPATSPTVRYVTAVPGVAIDTAWANVKETYLAAANGVTDDSTAIGNALGSVSTNGGIGYFQPSANPYRISVDTTFPATAITRFDTGAKISVDSGVTVTILGDIEAERQQIFTGSGTVSFAGNTRLAEAYPEWWGAFPDNSTDNTVALQKAINASAAAGIPLKGGKGTYLFASGGTVGGNSYGLTFPSNACFCGEAMGATILKQKNSANVKRLIDVDDEATNVTFKDFTLDGNKANNGAMHYGFIFSGVTNCRVSGVEVKNLKGTFSTSGGGIDFGGLLDDDNITIIPNVDNVIENCYLHDLGTNADDKCDGIFYKGVRARITGNRLIGVTDTAIVYETAQTNSALPDRGTIISHNIINANGVKDGSGNVTGNGAGISISARKGAGSAVHMAGCVVSNNYISGCISTNGAALFLLSDSVLNTFKGLVVTANVIRDITFANGLQADFVTDSIISNNQISEVSIPTNPGSIGDPDVGQEINITQNGATSSYSYDKHGLVLNNCTRVNVTGNIVRSTGAYGIGIAGTTNSAITGNFVSDAGRNLNTGAAGIISLSRSGTQSTGNTIAGNTCIGNYRAGINFADASTAFLHDNVSHDNHASGVDYLEGGSTDPTRRGNAFGTSASKYDDLSATGTLYCDTRIHFGQGAANTPLINYASNRLSFWGGSDGISGVTNDGVNTLYHFNGTTGTLSLKAGADILMGLSGNPSKIREVSNVLRLVSGTSGFQVGNQAETVTYLAINAAGDAWTLKDGMVVTTGTGTGLILGASSVNKFALWGGTPVVRPSVTGSYSGNLTALVQSLVAALASFNAIADNTSP